ncbi:MAG: TetR/AcrR family transcriptional regulator [Nocardioides sp.]|nr:TetR/AcrR family transcriptional regulator [Nocardioides sp.]
MDATAPVTEPAEDPGDDSALRRPVDKHDARRTALAESALKTLGERGFAKTSLREIAQNSEFSHGVVHYYFRNKSELITYCVRYYKTRCATRYDDIVETATSAAEFRTRFLERLSGTLIQDAQMHRLWYDVRSQALFDDTLRTDSRDIDTLLEAMIWRVLGRFAELVGQQVNAEPSVAYAAFDGLFQRALLAQVSGDADAGERLERDVVALLPLLLVE